MDNRIEQLITQNFTESIKTKQMVQDILLEPVNLASKIIINAFKQNKKVLICGNGGSAADSQHFAAEFTGRYEMERGGLPAIALTTDTSAITAIGNDYSFDVIFSKQIEAIANEGDVLIALSTSGSSANIVKAVDSALTKNMAIITLTGKNGGKLNNIIQSPHVNICVPVERTARIQEVHILILHTICDVVDNVLFKISN